MRCLVTGGGGFLGRYIVEKLLARGETVRVVNRSNYPDLQAMGVECVTGDLADAKTVGVAVKDCDAVFHVAAKAGLWGDWDDFFRANVTGARNILEAMKARGGGKLIYTSTPSLTFNYEDQEGVDESAPYPKKFMSYYSQTKGIAEQEILAAHGKDGLKAVALRPHLIWGPRDTHIVPTLIERQRQGKIKIVGDGKNKVDIVYVENAADAHLLALDKIDGPAGGNAYFISQGKPVILWDFINTILQGFGLKPVTKRVPYRLAMFAGGVLEKLYRTCGIRHEPPMTRFSAFGLGKSHYYSMEAARRDLGYAPKISTEEGLKRLFACHIDSFQRK